MLSQKAVEKVKLSRAEKDLCPYCESGETEGHSVDTGQGVAHQGMECLDCEKTWTDFYTLVRVLDHA